MKDDVTPYGGFHVIVEEDEAVLFPSYVGEEQPDSNYMYTYYEESEFY